MIESSYMEDATLFPFPCTEERSELFLQDLTNKRKRKGKKKGLHDELMILMTFYITKDV